MCAMNDEIWLVALLYAFASAVALLLLYFVVRAAILSALLEDRTRLAKLTPRQAAPLSHTDADGL